MRLCLLNRTVEDIEKYNALRDRFIIALQYP